MEETRVPGALMAGVARRQVVHADLLFKWLRQAGEGLGKAAEPGPPPDDPGDFITLGVVSAGVDSGEAVFNLNTVHLTILMA